jgi:hypothetical protein
MVLTASHCKLGLPTTLLSNQRSDERYIVSENVRYKNLSQPTVLSDATLIEASRSGLRLRTATLLTPGNAVQVEMIDRILLGEVVHCAFTSPVYTSGIKLSHVLSLEDIASCVDFV